MRRSQRLLQKIQMKQQQIALKLRLPSEGLYLIFLKRLESCKQKDKEIITFPDTFSKLSPSLQLPKKKIWELLYIFNDLGLIKIICGHGIQINYGIIKDG